MVPGKIWPMCITAHLNEIAKLVTLACLLP
jgi:hypothetical protein